MKIKKEAQLMDNAKNEFIKWLNKNQIESVSIYTSYNSKDYDYYVNVIGCIDSEFYNACFMIYEGQESIVYKDKSHKYTGLSILEFLDLSFWD